MLERFFALKEHETSLSREVVAGLTTFAAMAYILAENPAILSTTGMDKGALITATAVASGVMTTVMALATNYPTALAPGIGLNALQEFRSCRIVLTRMEHRETKGRFARRTRRFWR